MEEGGRRDEDFCHLRQKKNAFSSETLGLTSFLIVFSTRANALFPPKKETTVCTRDTQSRRLYKKSDRPSVRHRPRGLFHRCLAEVARRPLSSCRLYPTFLQLYAPRPVPYRLCSLFAFFTVSVPALVIERSGVCTRYRTTASARKRKGGRASKERLQREVPWANTMRQFQVVSISLLFGCKNSALGFLFSFSHASQYSSNPSSPRRSLLSPLDVCTVHLRTFFAQCTFVKRANEESI